MATGDRLRVLTFSTLFPNERSPSHGIFVETRLREMRQRCEMDCRVVAPVPWFPSKNTKFGRFADYAHVPRSESRDGVEVLHPRYPLIPRIGMTLAPLGLAVASVPSLVTLRRRGFDFDVIDAHYYYPDGVAATLLGRLFRRPVVVTARGTDLNLIPEFRLPRLMLRRAFARAAHSITVCEALRQRMLNLGAEPDAVTTLRNGVDLERFHPPQDRERLRKRLGLSGPTVLSIGHLIERKGHELVIEALRRCSVCENASLLIIGEGEERASLERQIVRSGLGERARLMGAVPQEQLISWYGAADLLVLASSREGWANVLLEAMACGTPVVATPVDGTPEVVAAPAAGRLAERDPDALANAMETVLMTPPPRAETRRYAEGFGWRPSALGAFDILREAASRHKDERGEERRTRRTGSASE